METAIESGTELYDLVMRDIAAGGPAARSGGVTARDLLVLLAVAAQGRVSWRAADLARELGLSSVDVSLGLERARRVGLVNEDKTRVLKEPMLEFLVHALRYVFPAEIGAASRGFATAPLAGRFVWPDRSGDASGRALTPLDPAAARAGGRLRELLGLVDVLRVGMVWERALAVREISRRFEAGA